MQPIKVKATMEHDVNGLLEGGVYDLRIINTMATFDPSDSRDYYHVAALDEAGNLHFIGAWQAEFKAVESDTN